MSLDINGVEKSSYRMFDFKGGLNTQYRNTALQDNESTDVLNMEFSSRGSAVQRDGLQIHRPDLYEAGESILKIHYFFRGDINKEFVFVETKKEDGTRKIYINGETLEFQTKTVGSDGKETFGPYNTPIPSDASPFSFFNYNNKCYFVNDRNGGFVFEKPDQRIAYFVSTIPKAKFALIKNERAFYTGQIEHPNYVYYSFVMDPTKVDLVINDKVNGGSTTTGAGGILQINDNDPAVMGIAEYNSSLIIFKKNHVYQLTGSTPDADWKMEKMNIANGCMSGNTIARSDNQLFYLSGDGVRVVRNTGDSIVESIPISDKINRSLEEDMEIAKITGSNIVACAKGVKYYISINNHTYVFDEMLGSWSKYSFEFCTHALLDETDELIFGMKDGYMRKFEKDRVNDELTPGVDQPIVARYSTPFLSLGEPEITKRFRLIKVFFRPMDVKGSSITVKVEIDYKDDFKVIDAEYIAMTWDETDWDTGNWDTWKEEVTKSVRFSGTGHTVRVTYENDKIDEKLSIHGFVLVYKRKRKVR